MVDQQIPKKQNRNKHRGSLDGTKNIGYQTQTNYGKFSGKSKISLRRQLDSVSGSLTIGELMRFYKNRRPSKEDLNLAHMILVLIYPNFSSQLFKIGMSSQDNFNRITWKVAKSFFETHSKFIVNKLKEFPSYLYNSETKQTALSLLKTVHHNLIDSNQKSSTNVTKEFITLCNKIYKSYVAKKARTSEENKTKPQEFDDKSLNEKPQVINDYEIVQSKPDDEDEIPNQDLLLTTPQEPLVRPRIYHEHSARLSENEQEKQEEEDKEFDPVQPPEDVPHERPVEERNEKDIYGSQDDPPIPKSLEHTSEENKSNIRPGGNIEIPMSPIEEQLARNEDSKESLPNIPVKTNPSEIKVSGERTIEDIKKEYANPKTRPHTGEKVKRKKSIQKSTLKPMNKATENKKRGSPTRNYQTPTQSWAQRRSKSKLQKTQEFEKSTERSQE